MPKTCGAVQHWTIHGTTYRLVCIYLAGHPGEHAAADIEQIEVTP